MFLPQSWGTQDGDAVAKGKEWGDRLETIQWSSGQLQDFWGQIAYCQIQHCWRGPSIPAVNIHHTRHPVCTVVTTAVVGVNLQIRHRQSSLLDHSHSAVLDCVLLCPHLGLVFCKSLQIPIKAFLFFSGPTRSVQRWACLHNFFRVVVSAPIWCWSMVWSYSMVYSNSPWPGMGSSVLLKRVSDIYWATALATSSTKLLSSCSLTPQKHVYIKNPWDNLQWLLKHTCNFLPESCSVGFMIRSMFRFYFPFLWCRVFNMHSN